MSETLKAHGGPSAASEALEAPIDPAERNLKHGILHTCKRIDDKHSMTQHTPSLVDFKALSLSKHHAK